MIEKCSIGNISYNIQNITLIILMLILIIVIIYYLKNSSTKHSEIIEKYTATNTNTAIDMSDTSSYQTHNSVATSVNNSQFPTAGTVVTLRDCQVQFNDDGTSKYEYKDGWQEIDTLQGLTDTSPIPIEKKIISRNNETNKDDKDSSGKGIFINYTEHSKCFKKMDGTTNTYKYQGNDLIQYDTDNHIELKVGANGVPENYMEMAFDLNSANSLSYYDNLVNSICSLNYSTTITGLSGDLIRLSLNNNNIITAIDKVTIDSTNNHIFNIDSTFHTSNLISGNSGTYSYTGGSYQYFTTNTASSGLIKNIDLYKFDRNLLCDITSNIKTYTKLNNAKIDIAKIINFNLPTAATSIANTTLPERYSNNITITGSGRTKDILVANMDTLINNELEAINGPINISITAANAQKGTLENTRDNFVDANNTKQTFINNAIIKSKYDDSSLKYNTLLNTANYNLILGNVEYNNQVIDIEDPSITVSSSDEPTIKEILNAGEQDIYEIIEYKTADNFTIPPNTECDILIVGGGGGGARNNGAEGGGGGGGGGVIHAKIKTPSSSSREITVVIGNGGGQNTSGGNSVIYYNNNSGKRIVLTADGGGAGGGSYGACSWNGSGLGQKGGSGGGGSGYCDDLKGGDSTGIRNKSDISNVDESLVSYTYYGNKGGLGHNQSGGAGGGGAGSAGASTLGRYQYSGRKGGDGINIPLFNNKYYGAGGGGSGGAGVQWSGYGEHGGLGGGGKGGLRGVNAANGIANTGSGGGGSSDANAGWGGSGIVILRYKKIAEIQSGGDKKKITLKNESITNIYRDNDSFTLNSSATAEILVVGGGGGGGGGIGGGGGAGAVVHIQSAQMPIGNYNINVGKGGSGSYSYDKGPSDKGSPSSISITGGSFNIVAEGGGGVTRGHHIGKGLVGGSGGGAAGPNDNNINTGGAAGTSSSLGGFSGNIYGYRGGNNTQVRRGGWTNATGGGGAGAAAADTDPSSWQRGNGGIGKMFNITGVDVFYGGGGGGGGHPIAGSGGLGGGGDGSAQGASGKGEGGAGQDNTGGGGGGGCWAVTTGGKGGSGIVVIKYNNIKSYRLTVKEKTYFTIVGAGTIIPRSLFLHGIYKIEISSTNTKIMKDASNSLSGIITLDIEGATNNELDISSNQIDITYNLRKSIVDINKTQLSIPSGTAANIVSLYNASSGGIPFNNNKYNRYKISTNISKTYKKGTNIDFNIELYTTNGSRISSDNYEFQYVFLTTSDTNVIIPIDIYLTIKPISNISGAKIIVKTYSRTSLGTNEVEIFAFIGNGTGSGSTSINTFNNITTWNTSLSEKNVWGIEDKTSHIATLESSRITIGNDGNIVTKCDDMSLSNRGRICDIKDLIIIKNTINTATFSTTPPSLKNGISITSSSLFPLNTSGSSILNYSITDYISYESATVKTPANRTTTFNILDNATKYVYFKQGVGGGILSTNNQATSASSRQTSINTPPMGDSSDNYEVKKFKESGQFIVPSGGWNCDILMIGGGAGASRGGGGAGACIVAINQTLQPGSYVVSVGNGGGQYTNGGDSSISVGGTTRYLAKGGGTGGDVNANGASGGCGGGAGVLNGRTTNYDGGSAVATNIVDGIPSIGSSVTSTYAVFGNRGGHQRDTTGTSPSGYYAYPGGGGGIGSAGQDNIEGNPNAGNGGSGLNAVTINGTTYNFQSYFNNGNTFGYNGFIGGGGGGNNGSGKNTGAHGLTGNISYNHSPPANSGSGANGASGAGSSGIVIIRYRT